MFCILNILFVISRNCKQLWRGDRSFIPKLKKKSPTTLLVCYHTTTDYYYNTLQYSSVQPSCLDVNWLWLFGVTSCIASNIRSCFANLLIAPAAWIFYMVILYVVLLLLVALIVSMVFSDSTKAAVLGIIYSLL